MIEDTDPFVFPEMPDESVVAVAIDQFLKAFYHRFQNHYFAQMHRWYHALEQRENYNNDPMPSRPLPDPPFWSPDNDRSDDPAVTIDDGPSPIVKITTSI